MKEILLSLVLLSASGALTAAEPIRFEKEERIVLIGGTLIEREQRYGYWETALTALFPDKNLRFRNFGWSGDTVWGESRAGFGSQQEGFKKLLEITLEWKPTTIIIGYGFNESFEGEKGLKNFGEQYEKLLEQLASTKAKLIFLAPLYASGPQEQAINERLTPYVRETEKIAKAHNSPFIQLNGFSPADATKPETARLRDPDGIQWTAQGYAHLAESLAKAAGNTTKIDWKELEPLRKAIVAKNELVFYRWRPQNETYLFGFRKHEQGKNAKEVFEFDPLIDDAEKAIMKLKQK